LKSKAAQRKVLQLNFKACVAQKLAIKTSEEELQKAAGPISTQESLPDDIKQHGVMDFLSTPDGKQKVTATFGMVYEIYKLTIASLLLLFVPMACYPCAYPAYNSTQSEFVDSLGNPYTYFRDITLVSCDDNGLPPDVVNANGDLPVKIATDTEYRAFCETYEAQDDIDICLAGGSLVTCTVSENINYDGETFRINVVVNFLTLVAFLCLYAAEYVREMKLIDYMEVNPAVGNTHDEVSALLLNKLPQNRIDNLERFDFIYQCTGALAILFFLANCAFSGYNIFLYYLDTTTVTTYLTSMSLMATKVNNVFGNVSAEKSVFYSAYLTQKVQYNDVDPDKAVEGE